MGLGEALRNVLAGSGKRTLPIALDSGEQELARAVASLRPGSMSSVGGDLVLTNRRLVFTPLDTSDAVEVLTWALGKAGAAGSITSLPGAVGKLVTQEAMGGTEGLQGIRAVAAGVGQSLLKPPTLVVTATDGSSVEVGILSRRRAPNMSGENAVARDHMLMAIRAQLTRA